MQEKKLNPNVKRILFIILAIVLLPVWVTVWILENKKIEKEKKKIYIIVFWGVFLVAMISLGVYRGEAKVKKAEQAALEEQIQDYEEQLQQEAEKEEAIRKTAVSSFGEMEIRQITYDGAAKGEYAVGYAFSTDCTMEKLTQFYYEYVVNNPQLNCCILLYNDIPGKGVYANSYWLRKNVTLTLTEHGDYAVETKGADDYYPENGVLVQREDED